MEIKIGADPEMFVKDRDGNFLSGHGMIPGTKGDPFLVRDGAVQVDGVALEFNIFPAKTSGEFLSNIRSVQSELSEMVREIDETYHLVAEPTAHFEREYFDSLPDEVKILGCEPDYSAYTGEPNEKPGTDEPFRTGAGHIHIGWDFGLDFTSEDHLRICRNLVIRLDEVLGQKSLIWDSDNKRRELYGSFGSFRPKHYGCEYRPLSNAFLTDDNLIEFVFDTTMAAAREILLGEKVYYPRLPEGYSEEIKIRVA